MIVLLAGGDRARGRVAGIVEPARVREPGDARGAGARDDVGERPQRVEVEQVEDARLAAVGREPVGEQPAVVAGIVPVERGGAGGVERVHVHRHAVRAMQPVAHVEHGMVLATLAPGVDVAAAQRRRHADASDAEQSGDAGAELLAPGHGREVRLGARVLRVGPGAGLGTLAVLEPAPGVGNRNPVQHIHGVVATGGHVRGRRERHGAVSRPARCPARGRSARCRSRAARSWGVRRPPRAAPG